MAPRFQTIALAFAFAAMTAALSGCHMADKPTTTSTAGNLGYLLKPGLIQVSRVPSGGYVTLTMRPQDGAVPDKLPEGTELLAIEFDDAREANSFLWSHATSVPLNAVLMAFGNAVRVLGTYQSSAEFVAAQPISYTQATGYVVLALLRDGQGSLGPQILLPGRGDNEEGIMAAALAVPPPTWEPDFFYYDEETGRRLDEE